MGILVKNNENGLRSVFMLSLLALLIFHCCGVARAETHASEKSLSKEESHRSNTTERYKLVSFNFHHVEVPYVICLWILLASIAKIGFHLYDKLPHIFPESCLLITLGILVGVTLYYTETANSQQYSLDANTFFLFLLPPIIYDAGYHMPNRAFFNNMGTILLLAVVNTLWNTVGIGLGLYGMSYLGWIHTKISILNCFVFSALISAVDPVAVLAIFEEIQVNEILYIIVFGESLLNDGVTVVLYHMMEGFTEIGETNLEAIDFVMGFLQFFIVVFGGTLIGVIYGLMGAFITKYTDHVRVIEPLFIFVLGYLAYLTAEIMELSGILALTFGGIIMRHYTEANMAKKSTTTVKYFMKMMANISETIIFMFLGLSTVIDTHDWHLDFILFTVLFCLIFRVTGVIFLSFLVNQRRLIRLTAIDQFIMSYGGLRGGIAFCLALLLDKHHIPERAMFVTTTTVMVFFTVFIQGITIKPVVNALKVEKAEEKDPSMNEMIHKRFIDHMMAGVEDIVGRSGHNSIQHKFDYYNNKYLKPLLLREKPKTRDPSIVRTFTKLSMQDAKAAVKLFPSSITRDPSFSSVIARSPSVASSMYSRRGTIAVPTERDHETTFVNLHSSDPILTKAVGDNTAMQHMLEDSMFEPRSTWVRERRHTLAEIHNHPPFHHAEREQLRHLISDIHTRAAMTEGVKNAVYSNGAATSGPNSPRVPNGGKKIRKNVSFSSAHNPLSKKLSDVAEISHAQETSSSLEGTPSSPEVVFTLGMPAPIPSSPHQVANSPPQSPAPQSDPAPSDPEGSRESNNKPTPPSDLSSPAGTSNSSTTTANPSSSANNTTTAVTTNSNNNAAPVSGGDQPCSDPINIPSSHPRSLGDIPNIPTTSPTDSLSKDDKKDKDDPENEEGDKKEETIAESSLPWRRQPILPPVPSSVSLSLPDDENPLMSEAPSWADNLAYSHLTETGSPYHSPQNTITAKPEVSTARPVFDIFPPSSPPPTPTPAPALVDNAISSIPPPWSSKNKSSETPEDEPLPSQSAAGRDAGDKVTCMLVSSHDLVPPSHHSCLQPANRGGLELPPTSRRHSEASSPVHFQFMEKPDMISASALESQLIGIEEDYHHGMKDRVSQWLANAHHGDADRDDVDNELARREDAERILESLRQKKEKWVMGDTDDGTDADVESDDGMQDTRL